MSVLREKSCQGATSRPRAFVRGLAIVLGLGLAGAAYAGDEPRSVPTEGPEIRDLRVGLQPEARVVGQRALGYPRLDLVRRVGFQVESISVFRDAGLPGAQPEDHVLYDELSDSVRHGTERALRKALKRYLIQATAIEQRLDRVKASSVTIGKLDSSKARFDVGFYQLMPEISMRYPVGHGRIKFKVGATGAVGVHYRNDRMGKTEIYAGFEGDDRFGLHYRLGF